MPVIHVYKTNHDFRTDRRLSYKARGILAYIMSHEHKWEVHVEMLVKESDEDGRIAVQSALQELLKWRYAVLETVRDIHGKVKGKQYTIYDVPLDIQPHRQAGFVSVDTDKQETRQSGNLSIGTDKQVPRQTENMRVGKQESDVDASPHRQAGFPSDGFPDSQETCSTKTQDLKTKTLNQDLPPIVPPQEQDAVTDVGRSKDVTTPAVRVQKDQQDAAASKSRASRIAPPTFVVTPKMRVWAETEVPGVNIEYETKKMQDYEFKDAKTDWNATWRRWMRTAWERLPAHAQTSIPDNKPFMG